MNTTNPYAPPATTASPRERWRPRSAFALRLYAASQVGLMAVYSLGGAWIYWTLRHPQSERPWVGVVVFGGHFACDVVAVTSNLMTIARQRSRRGRLRTRVPSVIGAMLGLLSWPLFVLGMMAGATTLAIIFVLSAPRLVALFFCLTARSIAKDVGDHSEIGRLSVAPYWQGAALPFFLLAAVVEGTAGADSQVYAVPVLVCLAAQMVFVLRALPSLLRLARATVA